MKTRASEESNTALQKASEDLKQQAEGITGDLQSSMATLASTLATRVVGVDVGRKTAAKARR
jgi:F-type H+-transporting ATPase subunit b